MANGPPPRAPVDARRGVHEFAVATLAVIAIAVAVAVVVFGLIVVLYDHGGPVAHAAVGAGWPRL